MIREKPLISVAMPFYNCGRTVRTSIRGMLRQSYSNIEIIAIDDGSSDDGAEQVERIRDPRVRLFRNERNRGVAFTRNRCLDLMRGVFLAPMDADDRSHPRRLEWTLRALQERADVGICGGWMRVHGKGVIPYVHRVPCSREAVKATYLFGNPYLNGTVLIRRKVLDDHQIRYRENYPTGEDYELSAQVVEHSGGVNLQRVLLYYLQNSVGLTARVGSVIIGQRKNRFAPDLERLLGRRLTQDELFYHAQTGNGAGAGTLKELEAREMWLIRLLESNEAMGLYDRHGLAEVVSMIWFRICRNSTLQGLSAWRLWGRSSLSRSYQPYLDEHLGFVGSMLRGRFNRASRLPQGWLRQ